MSASNPSSGLGEGGQEGLASLKATLLGWQELWDQGRMTDKEVVDALMHLDVDDESAPGEILRLRERVAELEIRALLKDGER